jgi:hypothetical protein
MTPCHRLSCALTGTLVRAGAELSHNGFPAPTSAHPPSGGSRWHGESLAATRGAVAMLVVIPSPRPQAHAAAAWASPLADRRAWPIVSAHTSPDALTPSAAWAHAVPVWAHTAPVAAHTVPDACPTAARVLAPSPGQRPRGVRRCAGGAGGSGAGRAVARWGDETGASGWRGEAAPSIPPPIRGPGVGSVSRRGQDSIAGSASHRPALLLIPSTARGKVGVLWELCFLRTSANS